MLDASVFWFWLPYCARRCHGRPDCAWTYSMLLGLYQQDCYGRRVYLLGFSNLTLAYFDPRYDIVRKGGMGLRGLDLNVPDIMAHTGQEERTIQRHLRQLQLSGEISRIPLADQNWRPIWIHDTGDELACKDRTKLPLWLYYACGKDISLAVLVAYVLKWLKGGRKKFHRSWNAMEKDTGIDRNTLKRAMWKAQQLGLLEFSASSQSDHWFWLGDKLEQAMRDSVHDYVDYLRRRKQRHIWTKKVPAVADDLRSRLFHFQDKRKGGARLWRCFAPGDRETQGQRHLLVADRDSLAQAGVSQEEKSEVVYRVTGDSLDTGGDSLDTRGDSLSPHKQTYKQTRTILVL